MNSPPEALMRSVANAEGPESISATEDSVTDLPVAGRAAAYSRPASLSRVVIQIEAPIRNIVSRGDCPEDDCTRYTSSLRVASL